MLLATITMVLVACSSGTTSDLFQQKSSELPDISAFDQPLLREPSYTSMDIHDLEGDQLFDASADVQIIGNDAILTAPSGGLSYAVFQMGSFYYADEVLGVTIDAKTPDGASDADVEYYIGVSYYFRGGWRFSDLQTGPGAKDIDLPVSMGCVSPGDSTYVCVAVYDGATVSIENIITSFKLVGRDPDHVNSLIPYGELVNVPVKLLFNAVDQDEFVVFGFSETGTISSDPPGITVISPPEFVEGYGRATIQFPAIGSYELSLGGFGVPVDGPLATVEAYETQLPVYEIRISNDDLRSLYGNVWSDDYYTAEFLINGVSFPDIRTRFRGGSSRELPKKSWKVKLNTLDQYDDPQWGYTRKTLNLNASYIDQSLMRDKLSYDLAGDLGMLTPRSRFIHLRVNDTFQGLYLDVENPRSDWLENSGYNDQGSMYKAHKSFMSELPNPEDYLAPPDYPFEKELRENEPADDLAAFIHDLNSWPGGDIYDELKVYLDTDSYASYMVLNALTAQTDAMWKNYYLYNDFLGTGKWVVFPWDYDLAWGRQWDPILGLLDPTVSYDTPLDYGDIEKYGFGNVLVTRYVNDPQFNVEYMNRLTWAMENVFAEDDILARIDAYEAAVGPDALADRMRWMPGDLPFSDYVEELREYTRQRRTFINGELGL